MKQHECSDPNLAPMRHLHLFDAVTERTCLPHRQIVTRHLYHNQPIRPAAAFTFMHIRLSYHQLQSIYLLTRHPCWWASGLARLQDDYNTTKELMVNNTLV